MPKPALVVIDVQNDYFEGGAFPLWNAERALASAQKAVRAALSRDIPVFYVQHVVDAGTGARGLFFNSDTSGVDIHSALLAAAPQASVVVKHFADSFERTTLHEQLQALGVDELILCGMMTQHCVTHTALSRRADDYRKVTVLKDATTTLSETLHAIALNGLSTRAQLATVDQMF